MPRIANSADIASVLNSQSAKILIKCISYSNGSTKRLMPRQLPPLTSLKAFEAAGRHLNVTRAAEELGVTQAAISQQIKGLEEHLNTQLFRRVPRGLRLTNAGSRLLTSVSHALNDIRQAVADINTDANGPLAVRLPPTFAAKWLSPRLKAFRQLHPEVDLRINHSNTPVDFSREDIDLAVTYGDGSWPGVDARPLLSVDFFPACSPDYLRNSAPLTDPLNLVHYNLLHDASYDNWESWLALAGLAGIDARRGTVLDDTNVLIQAAIDGQGIAMCSSAFVSKHLQNGRLTKIFDLVLENEHAYYIVCPESHLRRARVLAFQNWLIDQASI